MGSNFSSDDLIEIAKKEDTNDNYKKLNTVEQFILALDIKETETRNTESMLVYWAYLKWCKANRKRPLTRRIFFREFKKRFKQYNYTRKKMFYIDETPFKVEESEWWEMYNSYIKERGKRAKRKKRKEKAKSSKASRPEEAL